MFPYGNMGFQISKGWVQIEIGIFHWSKINKFEGFFCFLVINIAVKVVKNWTYLRIQFVLKIKSSNYVLTSKMISLNNTKILKIQVVLDMKNQC